MLTVTVEWKDVGLQRVMRQAQSALGDLTPIHKLWGLEFLRWIDTNFRREGSPKWAAIKRPGQIGRDTGRLAQSFTYEATPSEMRGGTNVEYARYFHEGTRPHDIYPVRAKALHFFMYGGTGPTVSRGRDKGANEVFAKRVQHPGTVARPLLPTRDQVIEEMQVERIAHDYLVRRIRTGEAAGGGGGL